MNVENLDYVKKMSRGPGVYIFEDENNKPLYIGRATSLRRRVLSYFHSSAGPKLNPRIEEMVSLAAKIKHYKTDNLLEAIILEANLIKKYWPKYNVKEKDDRSFIYIVIPKVDFSRPFIVRKRELQKFSTSAAIFGPYQGLSLITNALRIIRRIFPYSTCKIGLGKPCFDYQIGLCPGACVGKISKDKYQKNINNIILLLKGEKKKLLKKLKKDNPDKINALKHIQDVALVNSSEFENWKARIGNCAERIEGYDISHLTGKETYGSMAVFLGGKPDKTKYRLFKTRNAQANDDLRSLEEVVERRFKHHEWPMPDLIFIDGGKPQISFISKTLKKLNINIPIVGISKFAGDKLVFPQKTKLSLKELIGSQKSVLLKVREEAHRFAIKASRRKRKLPL